MSKKTLLLLLFIFLISCQSMEDARKVLTNQKIKTTDEFLVKKKEPLELPPEFEKIPEPGSFQNKKNKQINEEEKIKKIFKSENNVITNNNIDNSSTEKAILERINR